MEQKLWAKVWHVIHACGIKHKFLNIFVEKAVGVLNAVLNQRSSNSCLRQLLLHDLANSTGTTSIQRSSFIDPILVSIAETSGLIDESRCSTLSVNAPASQLSSSDSAKHKMFLSKMKCLVKDHLYMCRHIVKGTVRQHDTWVDHGARVGAAFSQGAAVINEAVVRPVSCYTVANIWNYTVPVNFCCCLLLPAAAATFCSSTHF
jgi:hypothetical protein